MNNEIKSAGITCDNYKVNEFKKELTNQGFNDFEVKTFDEAKKLTLITVKCLQSEYPQIASICKKVEESFK